MKNVSMESLVAGAKVNKISVPKKQQKKLEDAVAFVVEELKKVHGDKAAAFQCQNCENLIPDVGFCPFCNADLGGSAPAEETPAEETPAAESAASEGEGAGETGAETTPAAGEGDAPADETTEKKPRTPRGPVEVGEEAKSLLEMLKSKLTGCEFEDRSGYVRVVHPGGARRTRFATIWKRNGHVDIFTLPADALPLSEKLVSVSEEERKAKHLGQMSHRYTGDSSKEVGDLLVKALKIVKAADAAAEKAAAAEAKAQKESEAAPAPAAEGAEGAKKGGKKGKKGGADASA